MWRWSRIKPEVKHRMKLRHRTAGSAGHRRYNRISGQFSAVLIETLESPAWRVLSLSARRVLARHHIELAQRGGQGSAGLCTTYDRFQEYGIERHCIAPVIRELVALGLVRITREGRAGNSEHRRPTCYQLTFLHAADGERPTHDWRRFQTTAEARGAVKTARAQSSQQDAIPVRETAPV